MTQAGVHEMHGDLLRTYLTLGAQLRFGAPTTDEIQGASIYQHPNTGTFEVHGAVRQKWSSLGWENSYLGYPTSNEFAVTNGRRSNFQHGYIVHDLTTGRIRDFRN